MRFTGALAMFVLAAASASADAPLGFYLGGGFGWWNVSVEDDWEDCCYYDYYYYGSDYDEGEEDTAFSGHLGYRFHPNFAAEVGYLDAGNPQWEERAVYVPELDDVFDTRVDLEMRAIELSGLAILPFGAIWEAYVRAGAAFWSADAEQALMARFDDVDYTSEMDDDGVAFLFGLGLGVNPAQAWHLRLEYNSFSIDEDLLIENSDSTIDTFLFEVQYRFGAI